MATAPKKYPYVVYYMDQTYQGLELTKSDYKAIEEAILNGRPAVVVSIGIIRTAEIRSVLERIDPPVSEPPRTKEEIEEAFPHMSVEEQLFYFEEMAKQDEIAARRKRKETEAL